MKHLGTLFWLVILCGSLGVMSAGFFGGHTLHAATIAEIAPRRVAHTPPPPAEAREVSRQLTGSHSLVNDAAVSDAGDDEDGPPIGDVVVNRPNESWVPAFDARSTTARPRIALIVAEAGRALPLDSQFLALPVQLTFAVDPEAADASDFVHAAGAGHTILIAAPEKLFRNATASALDTLHADLTTYGASGVLTPIAGSIDPDAAKRIVKRLPSADVLVDGMAGDEASVYRYARAQSLPALTRDVIVDAHDQTGYIGFMLRQAGELAQRTGVAVVVARARMETLRALRDVLPVYEREGIEIVPVTALAPQAVTQR